MSKITLKQYSNISWSRVTLEAIRGEQTQRAYLSPLMIIKSFALIFSFEIHEYAS